MKDKGFIIWNGEIVEVDILWMRDGADWVLVSTKGRSCIKTTKEAVYPDRETPEKILRDRKQYETPIIEEVKE